MFLDDNQKYCWVNFVVLFISVGISRTLTIIFNEAEICLYSEKTVKGDVIIKNHTHFSPTIKKFM